jgi:hypothetical protein
MNIIGLPPGIDAGSLIQELMAWGGLLLPLAGIVAGYAVLKLVLKRI